MQLTQQRSDILQSLKRFFDAEINRYAPQWREAEMCPTCEVFKKIGHWGLLGLTITETLAMAEREST